MAEVEVEWPYLSEEAFKDPNKNPFMRAALDLHTPHTGPPIKEEHMIHGSTPLHKAAALLKVDKVDEMLAGGEVDVNAEDRLNQTPLILLSRHHYAKEDIPKAVEIIKKLINAGATLVTSEGVMRRDQYGDSPLHLAAMASCKNGPEILKTIVDALPSESKAKLCSSRCKNFGNTPLHWAVLSGDKEACQLLIDTGMTLDRKNRQKQTIMDYTDLHEQPELKKLFEQVMSK